jgi:acetyl esterase/lipase
MKIRSICAALFVFLFNSALADTRLIRDLDILDVWTDNYNASFWIEQGNLQPGMKMYGEADLTITSLSRPLYGADWIQTARGSGAFHKGTIATFRLAGDAEVYIAYHQGGAATPDWLKEYVSTDMTLTNSVAQTFVFFRRTFHKGDTVRLGSTGIGDSTMYLVAVKPVGAAPRLLSPAGKLFDVQTYGAKGDDRTVNTGAIQKAIDDCTQAGGGSVYIHGGIFVTGSLILKDNVTLFVEAGSVLRGSSDHHDYTPVQCSLPSYRGDESYQLIYAERRNNIAITGGGIIDGFSHGKVWPWKSDKDEKVDDRPRLIRMVECKNIILRQISLIRTAYWTQYYEGCDSLLIDNERVRCYTGQDNADGIDISGCKNVELKNYYAITGDDAVCIKSMSAKTTENLDIHDIFIRHANCHAIKIGTETHSDIRKVSVRNVIANARYGTAIESVDGAVVEDILYDGITLTDCSVPIFIRLGKRGRMYKGGPDPVPASAMRNITIRHLTNTGIRYVDKRDGPGVGSSITGIPGHAIENLLIEDCHFLYYGSRTDTSWVYRDIPEKIKDYPEFNVLGVGPAYGLYTRHIKNLIYRNIEIKCLHPDVRPAIVLDDVSKYTLSKISCDSFGNTQPYAVSHKQDGGLSPAFSSDLVAASPGSSLSAPASAVHPPSPAPRKPLAGWPSGCRVDSVASSRDKTWQKMYVYRSTSPKPRPLVISLHTWSGDYRQQDSLADETKAKDWNYIHPDFRGSNTRPEAGGSDLAMNDLDDAIDWAVSRFKVDTARIYVVGVSGGGYATLCAYGRLRHKVASYTAWVPISDLGAWYYESLILNKKYAENVLAVTGSSPDRLNQEEIDHRSPLFSKVPAQRLKSTPLTILAGVHDGHGKNSVPITQSMLYYNKLLHDKGVTGEAAFIPEKDMRSLLTQQRYPLKDSSYIGGRLIYYQRQYQNIRLVLFEGGHEMLFKVGAIY